MHHRDLDNLMGISTSGPRILKKTVSLSGYLIGALIIVGLALGHVANTHLRAMSLLLRFSNPNAAGFATSFANHPFKEEDGTAQTPHGLLRYRLYIPQDVKNPGGVLLLHGVHHLGIEDPRMWSLARALASAGVLVMTPELRDLTDYRVTPQTIDVIGDSAVVLSTRMNKAVGVIGLSFAGGLSLLTAAKPEYAPKVGFVLAIGSHDDMGRVARFFAANVIAKPDSAETPFQAHEYGVLVLAYAHLEDFFSPQDVPLAREILRQRLWELPDAEKNTAALSPAGKTELDELLHHRDLLREPLLQEIKLHKAEMESVSPHSTISSLHMPVYLLHGAGDTIIPASETLWLAKDLPQQSVKATLISPALVHVNMEDKVTFQQEWELMDFMSQILDTTDKLPSIK
jgi:pimeloyl-ACP methyl ester carboxylesterase